MALRDAHPAYVVKHVKPSSSSGWRRTVPSPVPLRNAELRAINRILDAGIIVIASGGGGIPVMEDADGSYQGLEAVIDKDRAGEILAEGIGADTFIDPDRRRARHARLREGRREARRAHHRRRDEASYGGRAFPGWKYGPQGGVRGQVRGVGGRRAIIASLGSSVDALAGKTGTIITS